MSFIKDLYKINYKGVGARYIYSSVTNQKMSQNILSPKENFKTVPANLAVLFQFPFWRKANGKLVAG